MINVDVPNMMEDLTCGAKLTSFHHADPSSVIIILAQNTGPERKDWKASLTPQSFDGCLLGCDFHRFLRWKWIESSRAIRPLSSRAPLTCAVRTRTVFLTCLFNSIGYFNSAASASVMISCLIRIPAGAVLPHPNTENVHPDHSRIICFFRSANFYG